MLLQFGQATLAPYRDAVANHMKTGFLEINHAFPARVRHIRIADVPLLGNRPIEHASAARYLVLVERNQSLQNRESLTNSIACDASADGVKFGNKVEYLRAYF